jgi:UDP-N-acetylmuramyl pentapeptide phosphotransferase/UDP-N-acetylglucosamine-1-phosphate transferase
MALLVVATVTVALFLLLLPVMEAAVVVVGRTRASSRKRTRLPPRLSSPRTVVHEALLSRAKSQSERVAMLWLRPMPKQPNGDAIAPL